MAEPTIREKIIEAALTILDKEGLEKVTSRNIAARAGVNLAAINYYFGSKNKVLNAVADHLLAEARASYKHLENETIPAEQRLRNFILTYGASVMKHNDSIKFFLYQTMQQNETSEYKEFLKETGSKLLQQTIMAITHCSPAEAGQRSVMIVGAIVFPALSGDVSKFGFALNTNDPDERARYFEMIFNVCTGS